MSGSSMGKTDLGDCDRCIGPTPATTVEKFSFGVGTFELRLCDSCADRFQDEMIRWSRLGTILDDRPQTLRRGVREPEPASRGTVVWSMLEVPDVVTTVPAEAEGDWEIPGVVRPRVSDENLPAGHEKWTFSQHAKERLVEREIALEEALWCAEHPDRRTPSTSNDYPDCVVHIRGSVRVVVDPANNTIVTVMYREQEQRIA